MIAKLDSGGGFGFQILDRRTLLFIVDTRVPVDRASFVAAVTPTAQAPDDPELAELRRSTPAAWLLVLGTAPIFRSSPLQFTMAAIGANVGDDVDLDVRVRMSKDVAAMVAERVQARAAEVIDMGFVRALDARADGEIAYIRAELDRSSIEAIIAALGPFAPSLSAPEP